MPLKPTFDLRLYLITDPHLCAARGVVDTVVQAVRGGVTMVQLRDKHASDETLIALGRQVKTALRGTGVRLIINDRPQVARACGADGAHIGQKDGDPAAARAILGPAALLGLSVENVATARAVDATVIDYVGVGPVFATATKPGHAPPLGFAGLAAVCSASPVPAVAIGGLNATHVASVLAAGAHGLAVVTAICAAPDPEAAARMLRTAGAAHRKC